MTSLYNTLFDAFERYFVTEPDLRKIEVPFPEYAPSENDVITVRASSIGGCPKLAAHEKKQTPPTHPKSRGALLSKKWRMIQSLVDGNLVQSALYTTLDAKIEVPVESESLKCRGVIDVLLPSGTIIEIKRRDARKGADMPMPSLSDCYQVMFYGYVRKTTDMHIMMVSRTYFNLWSFKRSGKGFILVNENGAEWPNANNNPRDLSFAAMKKRLAINLKYMREEVTDIPFDVNDPRSWLCYTWESEPARYKKKYRGADYRTGVAHPNCEYFCQTELPGPTYRFAIDENGIIIPEWDERFATVGIGSLDVPEKGEQSDE